MGSTAWQTQVSAVDRYEMVRQIRAAAGSMSEAVSRESGAWDESASLHEYHEACNKAVAVSSPPFSPDALTEHHAGDAGGARIGDYQNCQLVGDGITSEVYRSQSSALKVIVNYQNIEPHNPRREIKILSALNSPHVIQLEKHFRDQEQRLVLVFPYVPMTLAGLFERNQHGLAEETVHAVFRQIFNALRDVHCQGIIHRDVKPSAVLLEPHGYTYKAYLSDFGTAWHPSLSTNEATENKILDIGTGPYRAPEVLFGNASYTTAVDMWAAGVMLHQAIAVPPRPLFESRGVHEDGNQLGLILSIFKTLGTPTREGWPEAQGFKVQPFELWTRFQGTGFGERPEGLKGELYDLAKEMVKFESGQRMTAMEVSLHLAAQNEAASDNRRSSPCH